MTHTEPPPVERSFRMPVQDVYKFTKQGDDRRIVAGPIDSGTVAVGERCDPQGDQLEDVLAHERVPCLPGVLL